MAGGVQNKILSPLNLELSNSPGNFLKLYAFSGDPNGTLTAELGSICMRSDNGAFLQNTDGASTWSSITGPGSSSAQSVVYRPGGTAVNNVYTTFAAAVTAAQSFEGESVIFVDDSIITPAPVPVGTYDLGGVILRGFLDGSIVAAPPILELIEGVIIQDLTTIELLTVRFTGATAPFTYPTGGLVFFNLFQGGSLTCTGAGAMYETEAGVNLSLTMGDFSQIIGAGTGPVIQAVATDFSLFFQGSSDLVNTTFEPISVDVGRTVTCEFRTTPVTLSTEVFRGAGDVDVNADANWSGINTVQTNLAGAFTIVQQNTPPNMPYTPLVGANWVDPDPVTLQEALNRMASLLVALNAAAIPV